MTTPFDDIADAAILARWEVLSMDDRADILRLIALAAVESGGPEPAMPAPMNRFFLEMQGLVRATYTLTEEGKVALEKGREKWRARVGEWEGKH